jgi:hypothetical protein
MRTPLLLLLKQLRQRLQGLLQRRGAGWSCICWARGHNGSLLPWRQHCC